MSARKECAARRWIGWIVLVLGAVCAAAGLAVGQYAGVLRKAIFVCLECIGIG